MVGPSLRAHGADGQGSPLQVDAFNAGAQWHFGKAGWSDACASFYTLPSVERNIQDDEGFNFPKHTCRQVSGRSLRR